MAQPGSACTVCLFVCFTKIEFLCVVLAVLELALCISLELTEDLLVSAGVTDICSHSGFYMCAGDPTQVLLGHPSSYYVKNSGSPVITVSM